MTNRLSSATSPYLLQHAENPVDWHTWSDEAWSLARKREVPVFLSIGYAACHWCHVMAHESFEDPETAAFMNEHFVNIKVDREERPDIDSIYMDAVVAMTGQGGWPMSVFLTPEGKPFFAGTYFPPRPSFNLPAFRDVLVQIRDIWQDRREDAKLAGDQIRNHLLKDTLSGSVGLHPKLVHDAAAFLVEHVDSDNGGWGAEPKFPQPLVIDFLLTYAWQHEHSASLAVAEDALRSMAFGGIYDQVGGGFHRYSVDKHWLVPHFEKMLYDNAQLARSYVRAWKLTRRPLYRRIAEETLHFMLRDLSSDTGAFISSLDADTQGKEGKTYLWSYDAFHNILKEHALPGWVADALGVTAEGNFEGNNILHRPYGETLPPGAGEHHTTVEDVLERALSIFAGIRATRRQPGRDDKVILGWNGLALTAFAEAARAFAFKPYLETAQRLATFLLENLLVNGHLHRTWRQGHAAHTAVLQDHAALSRGLVALYQADGNPFWLRAAVTQAEEILAHFKHPEAGFYDTRDDHEKLLIRPRKLEDMPIASGNALAADLLLKLASLTGAESYARHATTILSAMQDRVQRAPTAYATWLSTTQLATSPRPQIAILDPLHDSTSSNLARIAHTEFIPTAVLAFSQEQTDFPLLLKGRTLVDQLPTAYVCVDMTCRLPVTKAADLRRQLIAGIEADASPFSDKDHSR